MHPPDCGGYTVSLPKNILMGLWLMWSAVFIFLVKILFGKEVLQMLVRLYAGEVILEKITIDDVPRGLRERVKAYLVEMGYIDAQ